MAKTLHTVHRGWTWKPIGKHQQRKPCAEASAKGAVSSQGAPTAPSTSSRSVLCCPESPHPNECLRSAPCPIFSPVAWHRHDLKGLSTRTKHSKLAVQRTMMRKIEAAVDPDSIFRYNDVVLGIHRPIARCRNVGYAIGCHGPPLQKEVNLDDM